MKPLNHCFQNCKPFSELVELLSRNRDPNMTKNLHRCTIFCRPEVAYDAISGRDVKTIEGYLLVNLEVASSNSFRDIQKSFRDGDGGGGHRDSIKRKRIRVHRIGDLILMQIYLSTYQ